MEEKTNYSEELKSPFWQKKRLQILKRDNFTCQICGCNDKTLNVHHLYYLPWRKPYEYKDSSLITLCEECHNKEHLLKSEGRANIALEELRTVYTEHEIALLFDMLYWLSNDDNNTPGYRVNDIDRDVTKILKKYLNHSVDCDDIGEKTIFYRDNVCISIDDNAIKRLNSIRIKYRNSYTKELKKSK